MKQFPESNYPELKYFEVGDCVNQGAYPGYPAVVVEVIGQRFGQESYRLRIVVEGSPEAFDENGEPETVKFSTVTQEELNHFNR